MLTVDQVVVSYGEAVAIKGVSFTIDDGAIITMVGANGAGKTTLVNTIAGILPVRSGRITFDGITLTAQPPHLFSEAGVAIVPEGRRLFTALTVLENLKMGAFPRHARAEHGRTLDWVYQIFPRLRERHNQLAGTLSGGEQQMLAIGRALMAKPRLLLLDEPSLGLAPILTTHIFEVIQTVNRETGISVLLVEQNAVKALKLAHYGYVISDGRIINAGTPDDLLADDGVRRAYLGV